MGVVLRAVRAMAGAGAAVLLIGGAAFAGPPPPVSSCKVDTLTNHPTAVTRLKPAAASKIVLAAGQTSRNKKADLTFTSRSTRDGVQIDGHGGDLAFRKT